MPNQWLPYLNLLDMIPVRLGNTINADYESMEFKK